MNWKRVAEIGPWVVIVLLVAGCGNPGDNKASQAASRPHIVVQLDWFAEPEHGGFFQAEARGFYDEAGLDVELLPGGPNANVHQKLATGVVQFGQSDSTNTITAIAQGLPLVNVAAVFQDDPSVLMLHASSPVQTFEDLDGKTIMARPEWVFLAYLRNKYSIDFKLVPQTFGLGQFVADPDLIQQGFYIAEPYFLEKEGVKPKFLHTWQAGFEPYIVLVGNRPWVEAHMQATRAFLQATVRGWVDYLTGDPGPAHQLMMELNDKASPEYLEFSRRMIIDESLVTGRGRGLDNVCRIDPERIARQITQLEELKVIETGVVAVDDVLIRELATNPAP